MRPQARQGAAAPINIRQPAAANNPNSEVSRYKQANASPPLGPGMKKPGGPPARKPDIEAAIEEKEDKLLKIQMEREALKLQAQRLEAVSTSED